MGPMKIVLALLALSSTATAEKKKYKFGQDTDWPPYAYKKDDGSLAGIGYDIAMGMNQLCDDVEIEVVETKWADCWTGDDKLGAKLEDGTLDACMTYTHARGSRDELAGWSMAFLNVAKAAGLITKLDANGNPAVCGTSDLSGKTVADVGGWAPTADTIERVKNQCDDTPFATKAADVKVVNLVEGKNVNDEALKEVLNGDAHALYVYADNAETFKCKNDGNAVEHDCGLWELMGKPCGYAYVQTGMFGWTINGTTLAMTKPGSPAAEGINQCLYKFMQTKNFHDICVRHEMECDCVANDHFKNSGCVTPPYNTPTKMQVDCSGGYCPCDAKCADFDANAACPETTTTITTTKAASDVSHGAHRHTVSALPVLAIIFSMMILPFGW